jgi:transposase InsO family protein
MMAIWRRGGPEALLHHSDRGSQHMSEQFQRLIADHGIVCSMSRAGNVWDNAAMESFFSSLKKRTARKTYRTRDQVKADVSITWSAPTIRDGGIRPAAISARHSHASPQSHLPARDFAARHPLPASRGERKLWRGRRSGIRYPSAFTGSSRQRIQRCRQGIARWRGERSLQDRSMQDLR